MLIFIVWYILTVQSEMVRCVQCKSCKHITLIQGLYLCFECGSEDCTGITYCTDIFSHSYLIVFSVCVRSHPIYNWIGRINLFAPNSFDSGEYDCFGWGKRCNDRQSREWQRPRPTQWSVRAYRESIKWVHSLEIIVCSSPMMHLSLYSSAGNGTENPTTGVQQSKSHHDMVGDSHPIGSKIDNIRHANESHDTNRPGEIEIIGWSNEFHWTI